jgi:hypothetical protein
MVMSKVDGRAKRTGGGGRLGRGERRRLREVSAVAREVARDVSAADRVEAQRQWAARCAEEQAQRERESELTGWVTGRWDAIDVALGRGVSVSSLLEQLAGVPRPALDEAMSEREQRLDDAIAVSSALRSTESLGEGKRARNVRYLDGVIEALEAVVYGDSAEACDSIRGLTGAVPTRTAFSVAASGRNG